MTRKIFVYLTLLLLLSSCAKDVQRCKRDTTSKRNYIIKVYSGGQMIFTDSITNDVLNEEEGNGMYYYKGDSLIELSGDYIIKSVK